MQKYAKNMQKYPKKSQSRGKLSANYHNCIWKGTGTVLQEEQIVERALNVPGKYEENSNTKIVKIIVLENT